MRKRFFITLPIILSFFFSFCNQTELISNKELSPIRVDDAECNTPADKCLIPSHCPSQHVCLYLIDESYSREFEYASVKRIRVIHTGTDCDSNFYFCTYVVSGGNPTSMGCVLPWCSNNCRYNRSVCLETFDGKTYTGDTTFSYPLPPTGRVYVRIHRTQTECDFGGIEKIND
ncbi:MAG: hypothetical protein ACP5P3_02965 [Ignavibacteria bacterium]